MAGTAQSLITAVASAISTALARIGWSVEIARGDLSAIACLYRQGDCGLAVVKWGGASSYQQARSSLVASHKFSVILSARKPLGEESLGQLDDNPNDSKLMEACDICRSTLRRMLVPEAMRPSEQDKYPVFGSETSLNLPDNYPSDAMEQTWTAACADLDYDLEDEGEE